MDINNVTQFSNFLKSNDFVKLDTTFFQLVNCINNYASACDCYKAEDKRAAYGKCLKLYAEIVRNIIPKYKNVILQRIPEGRITFRTENGVLIAIMSR